MGPGFGRSFDDERMNERRCIGNFATSVDHVYFPMAQHRGARFLHGDEPFVDDFNVRNGEGGVQEFHDWLVAARFLVDEPGQIPDGRRQIITNLINLAGEVRGRRVCLILGGTSPTHTHARRPRYQGRPLHFARALVDFMRVHCGQAAAVFEVEVTQDGRRRVKLSPLDRPAPVACLAVGAPDGVSSPPNTDAFATLGVRWDPGVGMELSIQNRAPGGVGRDATHFVSHPQGAFVDVLGEVRRTLIEGDAGLFDNENPIEAYLQKRVVATTFQLERGLRQLRAAEVRDIEWWMIA